MGTDGCREHYCIFITSHHENNEFSWLPIVRKRIAYSWWALLNIIPREIVMFRFLNRKNDARYYHLYQTKKKHSSVQSTTRPSQSVTVVAMMPTPMLLWIDRFTDRNSWAPSKRFRGEEQQQGKRQLLPKMIGLKKTRQENQRAASRKLSPKGRAISIKRISARPNYQHVAKYLSGPCGAVSY